MQTGPLTNYKKELEDCQFILRYLSTYPEVLQEIEISQLLEPCQVHQQHRDWKHLVSCYTGLEKEFYKDYWLPIEFDNYQFFIDLSKPELPIIETIYVMGEIGSEEYISSVLFDSATDFLLMIENRDDLTDYFEKHLMLKYFNYMEYFGIEDDQFGDLLL
mgnify:CR=1 FL=1